MKVLHLSNTPLSNAPNNIVSVLNSSGHEARVLLGRKQNLNKVFVGGDLWLTLSLDELRSAFETADVIHLHNFAWEQDIFQAHPSLVEVAKRKPCVVQYHSPRHSTESFEATLTDPFFKGRRAVVGQYHPRLYPECEWIVPNPLPLDHPPYSTVRLEAKWDGTLPLSVAYAPSNINLRGWDYKGYDQIAPVLQRLAHGRVIQKNIITNQPYSTCMTHKSWSHIGIEEFFTGSYHLSFLEFLALGCCTIGYMDAQTQGVLEVLVGEDVCRELPYVDVQNPEGLEAALAYYAANPASAKAMGYAAHKWMNEHWSPKKTAAHFVRMYEHIC